jgi:hypothetical protein
MDVIVFFILISFGLLGIQIILDLAVDTFFSAAADAYALAFDKNCIKIKMYEVFKINTEFSIGAYQGYFANTTLFQKPKVIAYQDFLSVGKMD